MANLQASDDRSAMWRLEAGRYAGGLPVPDQLRDWKSGSFQIERVDHRPDDPAQSLVRLWRLCRSIPDIDQSPRDAVARGSHVSFGLSYGYPVMQALAANSVAGDFRAPDTMRFGFAPLYLPYSDVAAAVARLKTILTSRGMGPGYVQGQRRCDFDYARNRMSVQQFELGAERSVVSHSVGIARRE